MMLFDQLSLLTANLSTSIRYSGLEIYTLLQQEYNNIKIPLISSTLENLENNYSLYESWSNAVNKIPSEYGLSRQDKSIIIQFGSKLGATDIQGQSEHCCYFKNIFQEKANSLRNDYQIKSKLYRTLGFFSGLAISLLIL